MRRWRRAVIQRGESYDEIYGGFRWELPKPFNIGVAVCDRHADGSGRLALVYEAPDGSTQRFSYDDLKHLSNRCANTLATLGIGPGDRVGVLLPQRPETAIAHIAIYKLGAVALPLFTQFGPDALEHRLGDSAARALITDGDNLAKVPGGLSDLATILVTFDYGNNLRAHAQKAGVIHAFDIPGFVPEYIRPLFCEGRGPFRWVALSGDPQDIYRTDRLASELFPHNETLARWLPLARARIRFQGLPARILLAGVWRARRIRNRHQPPGTLRRAESAHRNRPRSPGRRFRGFPLS